MEPNFQLVKENTVQYAGLARTVSLFFVSTSDEENKRDRFAQLLGYVAPSYEHPSIEDVQFVCIWRGSKILDLHVIKTKGGTRELEVGNLFSLGLNDFKQCQDKDFEEEGQITAFLRKIDLRILHHLYEYYWDYFNDVGPLGLHLNVAYDSGKAYFGGDLLDTIDKYVREGVFDDLLVKENKEYTLEFPAETGNKCISFFSNYFLLGRLCTTEILMQRMVFDEFKWFSYEPTGTINEVMRQHVSNRELIDRQLKLLDDHFWHDCGD